MPETHYFEQVLPKLHRSAGDLLSGNELIRALTNLASLMDLHVDDGTRLSLVELGDAGLLSGRGLFEFVMEGYRPAEDRQRQLRPIEKTPGHVQHLDEILAAYPKAKFVHILREPKNAISSLLKTPFVPTRWLVWHCARWNATLGYVGRFAANNPDALLTVKYEDVVGNGAITVAKVCEFLGIAYREAMLNGSGHAQERPLMLEQETWKRKARGPMLANRPEAWREHISEGDGWFIEQLTRRRSALYGYRGGAGPGLREKAATWRRQWRFMHYNSQEKGVGLWLTDKCLEMGEVEPARQLAMGLVAGDIRMLGQARVRAALLGAVQVRRSKDQQDSSADLVNKGG
jgi:hypothetical protein